MHEFRFAVDGTSCENGDGYCFMGQCPTQNAQCRSWYGPQAIASNKCMRSKAKPTDQWKNCGAMNNNFKGPFVACKTAEGFPARIGMAT